MSQMSTKKQNWAEVMKYSQYKKHGMLNWVCDMLDSPGYTTVDENKNICKWILFQQAG